MLFKKKKNAIGSNRLAKSDSSALNVVGLCIPTQFSYLVFHNQNF